MHNDLFKFNVTCLRQYFRHIGIILALKVSAILMLYHCCFSKEHRQKMTPHHVYEQLIGSP